MKELRAKYSMSQRKFADFVNINRAYLAALETGRKRPSSNILMQLKVSTHVSSDWLLDGVGPMFLDSHGLEKDALKSLGSRLRQLRERRGLSVAEAAAQLGADEEEYARYEAGEAEPPRRELELYASGLDANMAWLLDGAGEPGEPGDPLLETARAAIEGCDTVRRAAALMGSLPEARQEEILQLVRDRALLEKLRRQNEKEEDPDEGIL